MLKNTLIETYKTTVPYIRHMVKVWTSSGIGLYISWGENFERRPYIAFDVPFLTIQIFFKKDKYYSKSNPRNS